MNIVCFDTHVLIWGIKREANPNQLHMIDRAEYLLQKCEAKRISVIVPSLVVAELLSGVESSKHHEVIGLMHKRFMVVPFDTQAAAVYARLWKNSRELRGELRDEGISRAEMKADHMIVATAIARQAWCIYSEDDPLRRFANKHIEVQSLPEVPPQQQPLF